MTSLPSEDMSSEGLKKGDGKGETGGVDCFYHQLPHNSGPTTCTTQPTKEPNRTPDIIDTNIFLEPA